MCPITNEQLDIITLSPFPLLHISLGVLIHSVDTLMSTG